MSERQDKYWICDSCAEEKGLRPFKSAYTVISGLCGWCEHPKEEMLTPLRDLQTDDFRAGYTIMGDDHE